MKYYIHPHFAVTIIFDYKVPLFLEYEIDIHQLFFFFIILIKCLCLIYELIPIVVSYLIYPLFVVKIIVNLNFISLNLLCLLGI